MVATLVPCSLRFSVSISPGLALVCSGASLAQGKCRLKKKWLRASSHGGTCWG